MKMNFRTISTLLLASFMLFITSCLKDDTETRTREMEQTELDQILQGLVKDNVNIDTTALGVYYIIHNDGEGNLITEGDSLTITYTAFKMNGYVIDANEDWEFVYPQTSQIKGFTNALSVMNKNCEAEFLVPSDLAYGAYGYPPVIGAYETIGFYIKVTDIR